MAINRPLMTSNVLQSQAGQFQFPQLTPEQAATLTPSILPEQLPQGQIDPGFQMTPEQTAALIVAMQQPQPPVNKQPLPQGSPAGAPVGPVPSQAPVPAPATSPAPAQPAQTPDTGLTPAAQQAIDNGIPQVQGGALWKPLSESDGNLVMLFPYVAGTVVIKDAHTGAVLDTGRSTGASNGYADTVRFSRPGSAYQNVVVEDQFGNQIFIANGSERIENIQVTGYGFPVQQSMMPALNLAPFQQISSDSKDDDKKKKRKKGRGMRIAKSSYQAPKAPSFERTQVPAKSVEEFAAQFRR